MNEVKTSMGAIKAWIEQYERNNLTDQEVITQVGVEFGRALRHLQINVEEQIINNGRLG